MIQKRKNKLILLTTILLVMVVSFSLLATGDEVLLADLEYSSFQLDNGLKVYVFEDDSIPLVNSAIFYKIGSIDEEEGLTGIAHFLEHAMFLGTENLAKGEIEELISSVGGTYNAYTTYDYTSYYIELPSSLLELAIAIEADRMGNLAIDPDEVEREREVIRQERRSMIENNVFTAGLEEIQAKAFPESTLNHHVLGWMEDINSISVADLERYYQNYYVSNNAVLVISGDVELDEVKYLTEKYFCRYESKKIERPEFIVDVQEEEIIFDIELFTNVPITGMIYKIPEGNHHNVMAINVFLDILVNMQSSRIKQELQIKENLIMETGAFPYLLREPGYALVYQVPINPSLVEIAQEAFDKEIENIISEGIYEEELEIVRKAVEKQMIFLQRDPESLADGIAIGKLSFNNPDIIIDRLNSLNQLKIEDIAEVAKRYFHKDNRTIGNIVPFTN